MLAIGSIAHRWARWIAICLGVLLTGCSGSTLPIPTTTPATDIKLDTAPVVWPSELPRDSLQPGEELDATGYAVPLRRASYLSADSITRCGSSFYDTSENNPTLIGRALQLTSGKPDAHGLSWASYRLPLSGEQPAVIGTDINLFTYTETNTSGYWLGLSNYGAGNWDWYGPYATNHVRLSTAFASHQGANYLSELGNLFVCVVAYRGAGIDIVGLSADPISLADTTAPPAPESLAVVNFAGACWLEWDPVAADDLAGYRVYYSEEEISDPPAAGTPVLSYLRYVQYYVHYDSQPAWFRVSAVDINGNESPLSTPVQSVPHSGSPPFFGLAANKTTALTGDTIVVTATGAFDYDWDLDGDGEFDFDSDWSDSEEINRTAPGMLRPAVIGIGEVGVDVRCLSLLAIENENPVAELIASDYVDDAPMAIGLDASGSSDPDGYLVDYEWDLDGDNSFNEDGAEAACHGQASIDHTFQAAGFYNVTVRVTDDSGAQDAASVLIRARGWIIVTIDTGTLNLGRNVSLAAVDGWPAICYEDRSLQQLKYVRATTSAGVSAEDWPESIAIDPDCQVGSGSSLAVVEGNPAVAYYDGIDFNLKYARSSSTTGIGESDWEQTITVDASSAVGEDPSLAIIDGHPAISYYDLSNGRLKYARAENSTGVGYMWTTILTIDNAELVGSASRLATIDGHPAISYTDNHTMRLKYVRADTADGADSDDWTQLVSLEGSYFLGGCHNLASVSVRPALACYVDISPPNHETYELRYFRALTSSGNLGTDWLDYVVIDSCQLGGDFAELLIVDGFPMLAYFGGTADELCIARADTITGSNANDWSTESVDASFEEGLAVSMAKIAGAPAIAYIVEEDAPYVNRKLKYTWWYH